MKGFKEKIKSIVYQQDKSTHLFKPTFYRISNAKDKKALKKLLDTPFLQINDNLFDQLKELIKIKNASQKLKEEELKTLAQRHIGETSIEEYGVWVHYPWSNRLVHILDEEEFIDVRTSRNQYKITPEERERLSHKKIGVIGLSVGQSVSLTLAMERIAGELRLADFDILELTNLNRIRTGVHNLGLPKVYVVAREISEIDPFLKVRCFPEGLIEANMDVFFTEGGKLDLLVEECDGFDIKILSRYKAKALGIPVIMEASDRCMVDVERFDLEPNRSILHGIVDHLDLPTLKSLKTTEEKIPYMLDILGLETSSVRLKASMLEIDQSINTWPQLASAVTMGGGITADVSRRLLLNYFTESGRYYIDVEELIANKNPIATHTKNHNIPKPLINYLEDFKAIARQINLGKNDQTDDLDETQLKKLITSAALSPSGGNTQPWYWYYKSKTLLLFSPLDDHDTILGYNNYPTYVALGTAIETIKIQALAMRLEASISLFPIQSQPKLIASITFKETHTFQELDQKLARNITLRLTNRTISNRQPIHHNAIDCIENSITDIKGAKIHFITDDKRLEDISEILGKIEQIRLLEKVGHENFVEEIRWTEKATIESKDGIDLQTIDLTNPEKAGLKVYKDREVANLLRKWDKGDTLKKLTKKSIDSASAIGVISISRGESNISYINGGRAVQRAWLAASEEGLAFQPLASSLFIYNRLIEGQGVLLSEEGCEKLFKIKPFFEQCLNLDKDELTVFIFRLSKAGTPTIKSLRKPISEIYNNLEK